MSVKQLLQKIADPSLMPDERARLCLKLSKELEEAGRREEAREALRELWPRAGERPLLDGLDDATRAEVLCRVGVLISCNGSEKQIEGAQETAKKLISESLAIFEELRAVEKVAEAHIHLTYCYWRRGEFNEAHEHLGRARRIYAGLKDRGIVAQVDDTRARVLLAEGRHAEAERAARAAVRALERGDGRALLSEALTTHGVALARTGQYARARRALERALAVAESVGVREGAGRAALVVVEELGEQLDFEELSAAYARAVELLAGSQQPGINQRLLSCSLFVLHKHAPGAHVGGEFRPPPEWNGFSLMSEVRRYERLIIERALKDAGGVVTRAAQFLGFKHHNSLISRINKRHTNLLKARSPVLPRKRGIVRDPGEQPLRPESRETRVVTILHVEGDRLVAEVLKECLEAEGWRVESCADGATAMKKLTGDARYDLLLFDQELPCVNGLELVRAARKLPHRRRTPVVMLSASDCEAKAWRAGVDAFLHKPGDILSITAMISRLLADAGS